MGSQRGAVACFRLGLGCFLPTPTRLRTHSGVVQRGACCIRGGIGGVRVLCERACARRVRGEDEAHPRVRWG